MTIFLFETLKFLSKTLVVFILIFYNFNSNIFKWCHINISNSNFISKILWFLFLKPFPTINYTSFIY
nr:MAG TPA: hypothetical protein [Caudoviricetes sp.]